MPVFIVVSGAMPSEYVPTVMPPCDGGTTIDVPVDEIHAIWWRRSMYPVAEQCLENLELRRYATRNTYESLKGLTSIVGRGRMVVNDPALEEKANKKPFQLHVAQSVGFSVPQTLISNNMGDVRKFAEEQWGLGREIIYKPVALSGAAQQSTQLLKDVDLTELKSVRYCPTIFQHRIVGNDLRVTVIGGRKFALEQVTDPNEYVDARLDPEPQHKLYEIEPRLSDQIDMFMGEMGLEFGAFDFRLDNDGHLWFLECNPTGQWLWLETRGNLQLSEAWARMLVEGPKNSGELNTEPFSDAAIAELLPPEALDTVYGRALDAAREQSN